MDNNNALTIIIATLNTLCGDLLDADFATISEVVAELTGLHCDTKILGDIADAGNFPQVAGSCLNLSGYGERGFSHTPTLAKTPDGKITAVFLAKAPAKDSAKLPRHLRR